MKLFQIRLLVLTRKTGIALYVLIAGLATRAHAQNTPSATVETRDFDFTISSFDGKGEAAVLSESDLATFFGRARCQCREPVLVGLTPAPGAATKVAGRTFDVQFMFGNDCDDEDARVSCLALGEGRLRAGAWRFEETVDVFDLFTHAGAANDCRLARLASRAVWAILREDGKTLDASPRLVVSLRGDRPESPANIKVVEGDGSLVLQWDRPDDSPTLRYQALCDPTLSTPAEPAFVSCDSSPTDVEATSIPVDEEHLCSTATATNTTRIADLDNGRTYRLAVVAIDEAGNVSAPSVAVSGTPAPAKGFLELFDEAGGDRAGGCAFGGGHVPRTPWPLVVSGAWIWVRRRRRLRRVMVMAIAALAMQGSAKAADATTSIESYTAEEKPHDWTFALKIGLYRPEVDSAFSNAARPFATIFGDDSGFLPMLAIERRMLDFGGPLSLGLSAGHYRATAQALASNDGARRSADESSLTVVPVSLGLSYRFDLAERALGWLLAPHISMGLDGFRWATGTTGKPGASGVTWGYHTGAGVSLALDTLDPEGARRICHEVGVARTFLFLEVTRYEIHGFGASGGVVLSDTVWSVGLGVDM